MGVKEPKTRHCLPGQRSSSRRVSWDYENQTGAPDQAGKCWVAKEPLEDEKVRKILNHTLIFKSVTSSLCCTMFSDVTESPWAHEHLLQSRRGRKVTRELRKRPSCNDQPHSATVPSSSRRQL